MKNSICRAARRCTVVLCIAFIVMCIATVLTAAESGVQVQLKLGESNSWVDQILSENSAHLILRVDRPKRFRSAMENASVAVNGEMVTLSRGRADTTVELRFDNACRAGSVCRIQAGDALLKFVARPGQCYVCTVLTNTVNPAQQLPELIMAVIDVVQPPEPQVPGTAEATGAELPVAHEKLAFMAELTTNREEDEHLHAEAQSLQNELNQADARKRNADAYQVEITQLTMKRDALIAVRDNFWVLQKKTGGIFDISDATGGTILSELRLANSGIEARDREVVKLRVAVEADSDKAKDIQARLEQISAGRSSLERRRFELKKAIWP